MKVARSGFWADFCAIENAPKTGRFGDSYKFATSGAPTGTTLNFSRKATHFFGKPTHGVIFFLDPAPHCSIFQD
jgi:hypothetical protein